MGLNNGSSCAKVFCLILRDVHALLNTVNVMKQAKIISVYTGAEFNKYDFSIERTEAGYTGVIFKIKEMCPDSKIITSSLLPGK